MPGRHTSIRPRYGRIGAAVSSVSVTAVAVLGGTGLLPSTAESPTGATRTSDGAIAVAGARPQAPRTSHGRSARTPDDVVVPAATPREREDPSTRLPAGSGTGRRVVYSEQGQRVWLVTGSDRVVRTYLVSGSVYDNLDPGTYAVYSRSSDAVGIDDSGTMRWFVRFTQGDTGAAIGFHDIPVDDGERVQTAAELGTPTSHGCIRQRPADARALWDFAGLGTAVVVTP